MPPSNAGRKFYMEQYNLPSNPAQITQALVKASFAIEQTKLNYQKVLQSVESIVWTRENINDDLLAPGKLVAAKITEKKEVEKRPLIDAGRIIQNEYNSIFNPLNDAISRKAAEKKVLADQIQREVDKANAETARVSGIKVAIMQFIATITNEITESDTDDKIVLAEKKIGSETQRKNAYQEFLPDLKSQCDELKPLIKQQKEYVRTLDKLNKGKDTAMAKGDDNTAVELRHQAENMKVVIEENKIKIQEKAFEQVENADMQIGMPTAVAPNASRTWWKWRVDDIQLLAKKMPELVELVPIKTKIDEILSSKREAGEFDGKKEEKLFGITFYQESSYK